MPKKLKQEYFINRLIKIHDDEYDYSEVEYKNNYTKIKLKCKIHGDFFIAPTSILSKQQGCGKCGRINGSKNRTKTKESFICDAIKIHGNKYDYSESEIYNRKDKVKISCKIHGMFFMQTPKDHLNGKGCNVCSGNKKKDTIIFIQEAKKIHGDKYDYSKANYIGANEKICIICPIHGEFNQQVRDHTSKGCGCPECKSSKGERKISKVLTENDIKYIPQHTFDSCKSKRVLPFDFYLPDHNACIEFNGRQHYISVNFFGGEDGLIKIKATDKIKKDYCKKNNIKLFSIRYNECFKSKMDKILYFLN
jgi:hypothetical protein